jgi:signal transduction histidine kinase
VLVPTKLRVKQLLNAATHTFGGLAASRDVTLSVDPLLPALDAAVFVGDARRLQQCLNNGVRNAVNVRALRAPNM